MPELPTMDPDEQTRLAEQHRYITTGLGFLIHPTIEKDLLGKGTAVRVATVSQESQLHGADGEEATQLKFDPAPVHFAFNNIISGASTEPQHSGQFDIVAVRALHETLSHDQWSGAVQNLISLLRPGGWLQWTDWDPLTARIAAVKPSASEASLRDVLMRYTDTLKARKAGTTYRISTSMREQGLEDDDSDMYPLVPEVEFTRNVVPGFINFLEQAGNLSAQGAEDLRSKTADEIEAGHPLLWYDLWCHIARKPKGE